MVRFRLFRTKILTKKRKKKEFTKVSKIATKTVIEITITFIPISKNEAETKPSKTQNITLLYFDKVPAIGAPRIKNTINARPIVPAYKGV